MRCLELFDLDKKIEVMDVGAAIQLGSHIVEP